LMPSLSPPWPPRALVRNFAVSFDSNVDIGRHDAGRADARP
jgi:hypothetical protein